MTKWHGFGRCKTRLSKDIGKNNSVKVQSVMTSHTISVAKTLEEQGVIDIALAISGLGLKRGRAWSKELGIRNFNLQGRGCLGERMKRQILIDKRISFSQKKKKFIFIGTDLPDLCHLDILNALYELEQNDLILGPSNDGGYWLIGFSRKLLKNHLNLPFINIQWSTENVIQNTLNNFSSKALRYKFLREKTDIDTLTDIERRT